VGDLPGGAGALRRLHETTLAVLVLEGPDHDYHAVLPGREQAGVEQTGEQRCRMAIIGTPERKIGLSIHVLEYGRWRVR
jgi:hypothetical protein